MNTKVNKIKSDLVTIYPHINIEYSNKVSKHPVKITCKTTIKRSRYRKPLGILSGLPMTWTFSKTKSFWCNEDNLVVDIDTHSKKILEKLAYPASYKDEVIQTNLTATIPETDKYFEVKDDYNDSTNHIYLINPKDGKFKYKLVIGVDYRSTFVDSFTHLFSYFDNTEQSDIHKFSKNSISALYSNRKYSTKSFSLYLVDEMDILMLQPYFKDGLTLLRIEEYIGE